MEGSAPPIEAVRKHTLSIKRQSTHETETSELRFGPQIQGVSRPVGAKKALDKYNEME